MTVMRIRQRSARLRRAPYMIVFLLVCWHCLYLLSASGFTPNSIQGKSSCSLGTNSISTSTKRLGAISHVDDRCAACLRLGYWSKGRSLHENSPSTVLSCTVGTNKQEYIERAGEEELEEFSDRTHSAVAEILTLEGPIVDLLTPFTPEGEVDFTALKDYLQFLAAASVPTVICNGETGEFASLTVEERQSLVEFTRESFSGIVVNHVSASAVPDAVRLIKHSSRYMPSGDTRSIADAVLLMPPFSSFGAKGLPDEHGIEAFLRRALGGCELPVFLLSTPGAPISPSLYAALAADFPTLSGILDYSEDLEKSLARRQALEGGQLLVPAESRPEGGVSGTGAGETKRMDAMVMKGRADALVFSAGNPFPDLAVRVQRGLDKGDTREAWQAQRRLDVWAKKRQALSNAEISVVKAGVAARVPGFKPHTRPPHQGLKDEVVGKVMRWVAAYNGVQRDGREAYNQCISTQLSEMSRKLWNTLEVTTLELLFRQLTDAEDVLLTYLEKARRPDDAHDDPRILGSIAPDHLVPTVQMITASDGDDVSDGDDAEEHPGGNDFESPLDGVHASRSQDMIAGTDVDSARALTSSPIVQQAQAPQEDRVDGNQGHLAGMESLTGEGKGNTEMAFHGVDDGEAPGALDGAIEYDQGYPSEIDRMLVQDATIPVLSTESVGGDKTSQNAGDLELEGTTAIGNDCTEEASRRDFGCSGPERLSQVSVDAMPGAIDLGNEPDESSRVMDNGDTKRADGVGTSEMLVEPEPMAAVSTFPPVHEVVALHVPEATVPTLDTVSSSRRSADNGINATSTVPVAMRSSVTPSHDGIRSANSANFRSGPTYEGRVFTGTPTSGRAQAIPRDAGVMPQHSSGTAVGDTQYTTPNPEGPRPIPSMPPSTDISAQREQAWTAPTTALQSLELQPAAGAPAATAPSDTVTSASTGSGRNDAVIAGAPAATLPGDRDFESQEAFGGRVAGIHGEVERHGDREASGRAAITHSRAPRQGKSPLKAPRYGRYFPEGSPPSNPTVLPAAFPFQGKPASGATLTSAQARSSPKESRSPYSSRELAGLGEEQGSRSPWVPTSGRRDQEGTGNAREEDHAGVGNGRPDRSGGMLSTGLGDLKTSIDEIDGPGSARSAPSVEKYQRLVEGFRQREQDVFFRSKGIEGDVDSFNWNAIRRNTREIEKLQKEAVRKFREERERSGNYGRSLSNVQNPPPLDADAFNPGGKPRARGRERAIRPPRESLD